MKFRAKTILFVLIAQVTLFNSNAFAQMGLSGQSMSESARNQIVVSGAQARELFKATLGANVDVVDFCSAHTCRLTTKCEFDQNSTDKFVCTIEQTENL
jgi:hypothetical protein